MKKTLLLLAIICAPLVLNAAETASTGTSTDAWIVDNVLYRPENCGEPVAYLDGRGNILSIIGPDGQLANRSERP
ncbi:MAG: hypothetical protein OQL28_15035 [Sedimenticola sp.]|nr:hypothetical protein [Sedimenticola sp.]